MRSTSARRLTWPPRSSKDLKSYVYTQSVDNYDFTALLGSYVPPPGMTAPVLTTGTFSAPQNGKGAR